MPAIRDISLNYQTGTGTTVTVPLPVYAQYDLLIAVICHDGSATISSSGWTSIINTTNTCTLSVLWKIAGASESNPTFTATVGDSMTANVISIRDVHQTTPINIYRSDAQAAAFRFAFNTVTTTAANCLVLYCTANSGSSVPNIIEGPVSVLYGGDGAAESAGIGWGIKASSGVTPSDVYATMVVSAVGVQGVVAIAPPASGAIVIPTYVAADASVYIDPINGTTAFNGNTSPAQNPTTIFGTSLMGLTITSDPGTAIADFGLNPYHSVNEVGVDTTLPQVWRGTGLNLSAGNIVNMTGKALCVHCGPNLTGVYRITSAASQYGIAIGMGTSAGNWKIWQVHGGGTPFGWLRHVPLIIHPDNISNIGSAGSYNKTSTQYFCFLLSARPTGASTTTLWDWYSMWALDTITLAGGIAAEPMTVGSIVSSISSPDGLGKEHRALILQGANQMVCHMPVQIGDGGTNQVNMDLNNTAIEFPKQYDYVNSIVNFCAIDNWAGLIYYAGASDVIKHRNSIISSSSRYKWGLHSSSSTSASYDFSGLVVIGAGTITLARAITITGLTINNYSTLDISGLTLNNSSILNVPSNNDSVTVTSGTSINNCSIDVRGVTAGNRWCSTATPNIFQNTTFTGSGSTGHAMRITATGSFNLTNVKFTGFGADGTNYAAIFNDSGGLVTLNILSGGDTPTVRNGSGASTTIVNARTVRVTAKDVNTLANIEGCRVLLYKTTGSSVTITRSGSTATVAHTAHGYVTGAKVVIIGANQGEYNGVKTITYIDANSYSYTVSGTPTTPATGTITSHKCILDGDTNSSGVVENTSYPYVGEEVVSGKVRKGSAVTYYKSSTLAGTITSAAGFDTIAFMIIDL